MQKKKNLKAQNQKNHFKIRFKERFGVDVNNDFYRAILNAMENKKIIVHKEYRILCSFNKKVNNRLELFKIYINGEGPIQALYDRQRMSFVTALTEEMEVY